MFHTHSIHKVIEELESNATAGLHESEVIRRQERYGKNTLPEHKKKNILARIIGYLKDFLTLILLAAAGVSFAIGERKDAYVIVCIVVANVIMSFVQEMKADNALAALKKMSVAQARVIRGGNPTTMSASDLVPGDIIVVENGDRIPADARIIESVHLRVSESSLTGESKPVQKTVDPLERGDVPLGDRTNMVFKDTAVVFGRGKAVVTAIGITTEIGKIYGLLQTQEAKATALTRELERVGKGLTIFAIIAAVVVFVVSSLSNTIQLRESFLVAISMAVAVVPEGIPAVVTTVLALSVVRLARSKAVIRKLGAVETLGAATCILTDKTGTLTKNEMTVTDIFYHERHITVREERFFENEQSMFPVNDPEIRWLLECAVLCNDAVFKADDSIMGDPTEASLVAVARKAGMDVAKIRAIYPRVYEVPFSSETKRMIVVVRSQAGSFYAIVKGAPEVVETCLIVPHPALSRHSSVLAQQGVRNLAYAFRELPASDSQGVWDEASLLQGYTYLGVIGKQDPLRPEVKQSVALARDAGVRTVMITGDHHLIARTIGREIGIVKEDGDIVDGSELSAITENELRLLVKKTNAFSRVSPEQKLLITQAVMNNGETVIVTGDGVNDAPAIKKADIGVAMGISGTDVAKEAADMVLQDDNYATIVEAVRQGRGIFNNFVKFLRYQISCNLSGVLIVVPITTLQLPIPLLPVHILLLNLVSETGPSIALGLEKPEGNVMAYKPRSKNERLLTRSRWYRIIIEAVLMAGAGVGAYAVARISDVAAVTSAVLTTAFLSRLWQSFSCRSERVSVFSSVLERNNGLYVSVFITLLFLMGALYTDFGNAIFKTVPLSAELFGWCVVLSVMPFLCIEGYKFFARK